MVATVTTNSGAFCRGAAAADLESDAPLGGISFHSNQLSSDQSITPGTTVRREKWANLSISGQNFTTDYV